jgi:hypothetical protein
MFSAAAPGARIERLKLGEAVMRSSRTRPRGEAHHRRSNGARRAQALPALAAAAGIAIATFVPGTAALAQDEPWADDPNVQSVLAQRKISLEAMMAGRLSAETERYSSTFVANTPNNTVVPGAQLLELFAAGTVSYEHVEQRIDYAASHGPDMVVIMGEEIVVPGEGAANAGRRIHRRFTDVFRRENGEWRHDLRHANVIEIE